MFRWAETRIGWLGSAEIIQGFWRVLALFRESTNHLVHRCYLRTITLTLPTLLLLSYARNDIVCSPAPEIGKSTENRSR